MLGACSVITSLDGLAGGESDGGAGATGSSSVGASSSSGGATGGTGSSSGLGSSGGSGSGSGSGGTGSSSGAVGPGADAGDDAGGTSPNDGGGGAPPPDASSPPDAGSKDSGGGNVPDSAPRPYCATVSPTPLFCDDFDEGTALATPWDQLATTGGSESLSTASVQSAPYAMLVTVNPNTSVTAIDVAGYKSLTAKQGVAGTATTSFEIRINAADQSSNSDAILGAIQLWNGSAYWDLELEVFYVSSSGDFKVSMSEDDGSTYVQHFVTPHLALGTWTRVTLSVVLPAGSAGATTATMAFNGTNVASDTVHVTTSNPIPEILIGTTFATPTSGGWSVAYDNLTFDDR